MHTAAGTLFKMPHTLKRTGTIFKSAMVDSRASDHQNINQKKNPNNNRFLVCPLLCFFLPSVVVYHSSLTCRRLSVESTCLFLSSFIVHWWVQFPSSFPYNNNNKRQHLFVRRSGKCWTASQVLPNSQSFTCFVHAVLLKQLPYEIWPFPPGTHNFTAHTAPQ